MTLDITAMIEGRKICKKELNLYPDIKYLKKELELSIDVTPDHSYAGKLDGIVEVTNNTYKLLDSKGISKN